MATNPTFKNLVSTNKPSSVAQSRQAREELKEKINTWKKKAWLDFCKLLMQADTRYTLLPLSDYHAKLGGGDMGTRVQDAEGVFSNFCLTRAGELADVYIVPRSPSLGLSVDVGSKYNNVQLNGFPSQGMVWPILRIADELERQYIRDVSIESNKHGNSIGSVYAKRTISTGSDSNANSVPTDSQANGQ